MKQVLSRIKRILSNRLLILLAIMTVMFVVLFSKMYEIQIVNGHEYQVGNKKRYSVTREISAPRGEIFDRTGQPLAVTNTTVMIKLDPNVKMDTAARNAVFTEFIRLMSRHGEMIIDELPITDDAARAFKFNDSSSRELKWKKDMDIAEDITADEAYIKLMDMFKIPAEGLTAEEERLLVSMRQSLFLERFYLNPITVAMDISPYTQAELEERNQDFPGFYIDIGYTREYPEGEYAAHLLGYLRRISGEQLEERKELGYTADDIVGQVGIELAFEEELRGVKGREEINTDSSGRRLGLESTVAAVSGNNVYLTLDIDLQRRTYDILERQLTDIIIAKLRSNPKAVSKRGYEDHITTLELLASMAEANSAFYASVMNAEEGALSYPIKLYVMNNSELDSADEDYKQQLKDFLSESFTSKRITEHQVLLAMYEQGIVVPTEEELERMKRGTLNVQNFLVRMLDEGYVTPQMTNVHPCTGSVVVTDVNTGEILAAVSYPSYDNNRLSNVFDYNYYSSLLNDPTKPLIIRAFNERSAVGSTFKMITAITGLENGVIQPSTRIFDEYRFTKAGQPAHCTAHHGTLNVEQAIMHSCNYFFYETAYRLGNAKEGKTLEGIKKLNDYMAYFGLGMPTGVEFGDVFNSTQSRLPEGVLPISSPEYRLYRTLRVGWGDGDTIRTAIGQAENNLTCAGMAKYTATLASGGKRYKLFLMDHVETFDGNLVYETAPILEDIVPMSESTINVIHRGMYAVTNIAGGTAYNIFRNFPVQVAGKTGTAQETNWPDHITFSAFAPYENPSVAVYVLIPGSNQSSIRASAGIVARNVLSAYFKLDAVPQKADVVNELVMR